MNRLISTFVLLTAAISSAFGAEDLRGNLYLVYPVDVTLYGRVSDLLNTANNTFRIQICWDDPAYTANCDVPVTANTTVFPFATCSGASCDGFHYPIPTGPVGGVTPRDGNSHLMYVKVLSQASPGPGDKPLDGSPWPFTYKNGTVAAMWAPNLETTPSRLTAAQLAILANSNDPYSVGASGAVVCTVGGVPIKDDGVAGYYAKRHNVPCANISVVAIPVAQILSQANFTSIVQPVLQGLSPSLQAIAIAWVQPSDVGNTFPQSISAVVANGGFVMGKACANGEAFLGQGPVSPYFNSSSQAPFTDHHLRPAMMLAGEICPACTAINNYTYQWIADFPTMKGVIDAAIAATDTDPSGGNVDWAWTSDLKRSQTAVLVSPLELGGGLSPKANAQILGSHATPTPYTVSARNILLYSQAAPNWNYSSPTFLPGAGIGFAVTSTSGWLPSDGNQTTAASWLSQGAVGAFGTGVEPCELFTYKHPDPGLVIPNYTQGQTLVESLWKSVRLPWGGNFLGDPLAAPFTLAAGTGNPAPVLSSINPASAAQGSSLTVTLGGLNFTAPATVVVQGAGVTVSNTAVLSTATVAATFTVAAGATPGAYNVSVTTPAGSTGTVPFQVTSSAPSISFISPAAGSQGASVQVTITGANFTPGATVAVSGSGVTASNVNVTGSTQIVATLTIAASAAAGSRAVSVTTASGVGNTVSFTVNAVQSPPSLTSVSPNSGSAGSVVNVTLTGANFTPGATVTVSGSGVTAGNVSVVSATQITAAFTIAASAAAGSRAVSVTTPSGVSNTVNFTVNAVQSPPSLNSILPNSGSAASVVNVTLTGANFTPGATVAVSGSGVTAGSVSFVSATQITAAFTIAANAAAGPSNVSVTTSAGTSNTAAFTVTATGSAPTLTSMTPNSGNRGTSVNVVLTGANFTPGTTVRLGGLGASMKNLMVVGSTQIDITFVLATTGAGVHNVYVTNTAGSSAILPFTVY